MVKKWDKPWFGQGQPKNVFEFALDSDDADPHEHLVFLDGNAGNLPYRAIRVLKRSFGPRPSSCSLLPDVVTHLFFVE
jgi:hypothetical protein